jgi:hypothetical protein
MRGGRADLEPHIGAHRPGVEGAPAELPGARCPGSAGGARVGQGGGVDGREGRLAAGGEAAAVFRVEVTAGLAPLLGEKSVGGMRVITDELDAGAALQEWDAVIFCFTGMGCGTWLREITMWSARQRCLSG